MNNSSICIDANLLIQLVIGGPQATLIATLWSTWQEANRPVAAPTLLYYEVSNALHRYVVAGILLPEEAAKALTVALNFNIALYGDGDLHQHAIKLAQRFSLPAAYDAHYLALAERLEAEFWTTDRRLAQATQPVLSWVHQLE